MLYGRRIELGTDAFEHGIALAPFIFHHADLDELVSEEIDVDLVQDRGGQPLLADADDRMQMVRLRPKNSALVRCQESHALIAHR